MMKNEIIGRLQLWETAIHESQSLLRLHKRAILESQQNYQRKEQEENTRKLHDFIKKRDDYKEGTITSTQLNAFYKEHERPFPYLGECFAISDACLNLAIIYFCQIFNFGEKKNNSAAKNTIQFREEHLNIILERIFPTCEKRTKYNQRVKKLRCVRNEMIGHADATTLNIEHKEFVTTIGGPQNITRNLDIDYWLSVMELLRTATLTYMNELRKN